MIHAHNHTNHIHGNKECFNHELLIEMFCCTLLSALLIFLVLSNRYLSFVTPKMRPYILFTSIVLFIWALYDLYNIFTVKHENHYSHCLILIIPMILIILALFFGNTENVSKEFISNSSNSNISCSDGVTLHGYDKNEKSIIISDEEYYPWLVEIFNNPKKYLGYKIKLKACVLKDEDCLSENQFILSRQLMTCCVADLVNVGFVGNYDYTESLKENSWITVDGILVMGKYEGKDEIQIDIKNVSPAKAPKETYIYPHNNCNH